MPRQRKRTEKKEKPTRKEEELVLLLRGKGRSALLVIGLFVFSTLAYAFLSGGRLDFQGGEEVVAASESPESRDAAMAIRNPYALTQEFLEEGKRIYLQRCVECHLEDGGGPEEHSIKEMASHHTEGDYFWVATYGLADTNMSGWKEILTPEERWKVTSYMRLVLGGVEEQVPQEAAQEPTAPLKPQPELAELVLPENFDSLSDGLKMTPEGIFWARFVNAKLANGTPLEEHARGRIQQDVFYGRKIVGMFSADYTDNTWIEFHDLGYDEPNAQPRYSIGMINDASARPFVYGHAKNVNIALDLRLNPGKYKTAHDIFGYIMQRVNENVAIAEVFGIIGPFADMGYLSLNATENGIERVTAYRITNASAVPTAALESLKDSYAARGLSEYGYGQEGDVLFVRMVSSNLTALLSQEL